MAPEDEKKVFDEMTQGVVASPEAKATEEAIELKRRFAETVDRLDQEQLGRAIVINRPKTPPSSDAERSDVARLADAIRPPTIDTERELVGYILPLNEDDTKQLIVFKNGEMLVGELPQVVESNKSRYKSILCPGQSSYTSGLSKEWKSMQEAIEHFRNGYAADTSMKVTHSNSTEAQVPQFDGFFDRAIDLGRSRKAEKERAKTSTMGSFMSRLDASLFKPQGTPDAVLPPIAPPDQPTGQE